jgi:hypothetical protein
MAVDESSGGNTAVWVILRNNIPLNSKVTDVTNSFHLSWKTILIKMNRLEIMFDQWPQKSRYKF